MPSFLLYICILSIQHPLLVPDYIFFSFYSSFNRLHFSFLHSHYTSFHPNFLFSFLHSPPLLWFLIMSYKRHDFSSSLSPYIFPLFISSSLFHLHIPSIFLTPTLPHVLFSFFPRLFTPSFYYFNWPFLSSFHSASFLSLLLSFMTPSLPFPSLPSPALLRLMLLDSSNTETSSIIFLFFCLDGKLNNSF